MSDNTTVVAYINHQGGTTSSSLSLMAENLLLHWHQQGLLLSARHLAGVSNVLADFLSRQGTVVHTEWTLSRSVLQPVWERWDKPLIDLFATRFSNRLEMFVSPVPDPFAWAVDAFSFSWKGLFLYAFPPFALLEKVISKVRSESPRMILVAPSWPARPWFADLLRLSKEPPLPLVVRPRTLVQPRSGLQHPDPSALSLHAWRL